MNVRRISNFMLILIFFALLISACAAPRTISQEISPQKSGDPPAEEPAGGQTFAEERTLEALSDAPAKGYVLFDLKTGTFFGYAMDHSITFEVPAPGLLYPSPDIIDVVEGGVYYMQDEDKKVFRASPEGRQLIDIPVENLHAFAVSPNEQWIAWASTNWGSKEVSSTLWISELDASHKLVEPRQIAAYSSSQSEAFNLIPLEWTEDNLLLFDRFVSGLGGYILFGGHNSLYSYEPVHGQFTTIVPAEEMHGICLDSYRLDLERVVFMCGKNGSGITIRSLDDFSSASIPAAAEFPVVGSAVLSPSGRWLAYAAARRNPDDEAGLVLVAPASLDTSPVALAQATGNRYASILGWLDDETIFYSVNKWPEFSLWSVKLDGSGGQQLHSGKFFSGWIR
jgi:hypothetical protein